MTTASPPTHHSSPVGMHTARNTGTSRVLSIRRRTLRGIETVRRASARRSAVTRPSARREGWTVRSRRATRRAATVGIWGERGHPCSAMLASLYCHKEPRPHTRRREAAWTHSWRTHPRRRHRTVRRERGRTWGSHHAGRTWHTRRHRGTT